MIRLKESLLDDEEELVNSETAVTSMKQDIIKFIKDNYVLHNSKNYATMNITRNIKINDDLTVDIKKSYNRSPLLRSKWGNLPVKGFKWGKIWNVRMTCTGMRKLENLPTECNQLELLDTTSLVDLSGLPKKVNNLVIYDLYGVTDLKTMPHNIEIEKLELQDAHRLVSLEGCPKKLERLTINNCDRVSKVPYPIYCDVFAYYGTIEGLKGDDMDNIKCRLKHTQWDRWDESLLDDEEDVLNDVSFMYNAVEQKISKNTYIYFRRKGTVDVKGFDCDGAGFMIEPWKAENGAQRFNIYMFLASDEFLSMPNNATAKKNQYLLIANQDMETDWDFEEYGELLAEPLKNIKKTLTKVLNGIKDNDNRFHAACEMFKHAKWKNLDPTKLPATYYFGEICTYIGTLFQDY